MSEDTLSTIKDGIHYAHKVADKVVERGADVAKEAAMDAREVGSRAEDIARDVASESGQGVMPVVGTAAVTEGENVVAEMSADEPVAAGGVAASGAAAAGEPSGLLGTAGKLLGGVGTGLGLYEAGEGALNAKETLDDAIDHGLSVDDGLNLASDSGKIVGGSSLALSGVQKLAPSIAGAAADALPGLADVAGSAVPILGLATAVGSVPKLVDAVQTGDVKEGVASTLKLGGGAVMAAGLVMDTSGIGAAIGVPLNVVGGAMMLAGTLTEHSGPILAAAQKGFDETAAADPEGLGQMLAPM